MNQLRKLNFATPCRRLKGHLPKIWARGGVEVKEGGGGSVRRCIFISARFAKNYNCVHGHFSLNWQTQVCCQCCCLPALQSAPSPPHLPSPFSMHLAVLFQRRRIVWQPRTLRTRQSQIKTFLIVDKLTLAWERKARERDRERVVRREMGSLSECECRGKSKQSKWNETKPKTSKLNRKSIRKTDMNFN